MADENLKNLIDGAVISCVAGAVEWKLRKITVHDWVAVTGQLPRLAIEQMTAAPDPKKSVKFNDEMLARCCLAPTITLDDPAEVPEGMIPMSRIPDEVYSELVTRLFSESGFTRKAADEIRPTSGAAEPS